MSPRPGWRNGIRGRLKPVCPKGHRGSTPLSGTCHPLLPRGDSAAGADKRDGRVSRQSGAPRRWSFKHLRFIGPLPIPSRSFRRPVPKRGVEDLCSFGPLTKATTAGGREGKVQHCTQAGFVCDHKRPNDLLRSQNGVVSNHNRADDRSDCDRLRFGSVGSSTAARRFGVRESCWCGRRHRAVSRRR
jgi:hypothetical protein